MRNELRKIVRAWYHHATTNKESDPFCLMDDKVFEDFYQQGTDSIWDVVDNVNDFDKFHIELHRLADEVHMTENNWAHAVEEADEMSCELLELNETALEFLKDRNEAMRLFKLHSEGE